MKFKFTLLCLITAFTMHAQYQDNTWVFGYSYNSPGLMNGIFMDFRDSLSFEYKPHQMYLSLTNASISDSSGNLLAYTNGCYFLNRFGNFIEGSDHLNPGITFELFCNQEGYNSSLNTVLLPDISDNSKLIYIHSPIVESPTWIFAKSLLYTKIDIDENSGQGKTLAKNQEIFFDTIAADGIHAVKHGNGRDFWVVSAKENSNLYHFSLLTPSGIYLHHTQKIGDIFTSNGGGSITISPDGNKLARYNPQNDLRIFDFDRCTGMLSNAQNIYWSDGGDFEVFGGCAFSADSRYLYISSGFLLYQFDLQNSQVESTRTLVGEWDGTNCPFTCNFGKIELAPDGTILITPSSGSTNAFHRIRSPEKPSNFCNFVNQDIYLSTEFDFVSMPHFAVFRLGPMDGSSCDTLGLDNHPLANWRHWASNLVVDFTSLSTYAPDYWHWTFGDGGESFEKYPLHEYAQAGSYWVCHDVGNGYGKDTLCRQITVGNIATLQPAIQGVMVYPNPASDWITLELSNTEATQPQVRIYDILGKVVLEEKIVAGKVSVDSLAPGLYYIDILVKSGERLTGRFMKE